MTSTVKEGTKNAPDVKVKKIAKKRKTRSLDKVRARAGWLFVLPFIIGLIGIYAPIVFSSIKETFMDNSVFGQETFAGWDNYVYVISSYGTDESNFLSSVFAGLQQMVIDIPAILIFSLFMAVLLNQKMAGRAVFRAIFFVPVILSTGIMENINSMNMSAEGAEGGISTGAETATDNIVSVMDVQFLFSNLMIGQGLAGYVAQLINNIFAIVNRSGVQMLIFLAGLQSISPAIYESCQIDGATSWETFWKITFPMITPMILVNAVYTVIDSFTTKANVTMSFISGASVTEAQRGAMSWMYFLVVILILAIVSGILSAFVFYQRRD